MLVVIGQGLQVALLCCPVGHYTMTEALKLHQICTQYCIHSHASNAHFAQSGYEDTHSLPMGSYKQLKDAQKQSV